MNVLEMPVMNNEPRYWTERVAQIGKDDTERHLIFDRQLQAGQHIGSAEQTEKNVWIGVLLNAQTGEPDVYDIESPEEFLERLNSQ